MKFMITLASLVAAVSAGACECPKEYTALLEGQSKLSAGHHGHVHLPDCCNGKGWSGTVAAKHTPGTACSEISSCGTCTLMDFCKWGGVTAVSGGAASCSDLNAITEENMSLYSGSCHGKGDYKPAEVVDLDLGKTDFQKTALYDEQTKTYMQQFQGSRVDTAAPHIEYGAGNFAGMFDGYLPPAACSHSNDVAPNSPGCAGYKSDDVAFIYPQFYFEGQLTSDLAQTATLPTSL